MSDDPLSASDPTTGFAEVLLRLVDGDAPEEVFHAAAGAYNAESDVARAELLESSLHIRSKVHRLRARERELTALYNTALELSEATDPDAVLALIVRRTRLIVGSDLTYLALVLDEELNGIIQVADGAISGRLHGLILPLGVGVGGMVVQTKSPVMTNNYADDGRFSHERHIESVVHGEHLRSLAAVPLLRADRVIGVLFAGERTGRAFTEADLSLMSSLGAYAAVAIETRRAEHDLHVTVEQLRAANEQSVRYASELESSASAHDRLTELVLRSASLDDLTTTLRELIDGDIVLTDERGAVTAQSWTGEPVSVPDERTLAADTASSPEKSIERSGWRIAFVAAGPERLGTLLARTPTPLGEMGLRTLERAATVAAVLLSKQRERIEAENEVRGELLFDILLGVQSPRILGERASRFDIDAEGRWQMLVVRSSVPLYRMIRGLEERGLPHPVMSTVFDNQITMVLPALDSRQERVVLELVADPELAQRETTLALSLPVAGVTALPLAYRRADQCVAALIALGRTGDSAMQGELGVAEQLLGPDADWTAFIDDHLAPVADYDARGGSQLLETLDTYFELGESPSRVAARLHVHINTVSQRLARVENLLGASLKDPPHKLNLQLALLLKRLASRERNS